MMLNSDMDKLIAKTERIGSIGSPSSTSELSLDIHATAVSRKLVGELAFFKFMQDSKSHYALGQITEIKLRNIWLEDPTIRSLARQRGVVNPISGNQDTHLGTLTIGTVLGDNGGGSFNRAIFGTVPATGTFIQIANDEVLSTLFQRYSTQIFYMGYVYGSKTKLPLIFQQFSGGKEGADEAYHIGIFGKTGSGKSTLAKMMLIAYAKHPTMAIFVLDPAGEFAKSAEGNFGTEMFQLNMREILQKLSKEVIIIRVRELVLDRWNLFTEILQESAFFDHLIPRQSAENRRLACEILASELQDNHVTLARLHEQQSFNEGIRILSDPNIQQLFYRTPSSRAEFATALQHINQDQLYERHWNPICQLFRTDRPNVRRTDSLISEVFDTTRANRPVVIIDISPEQNAEAFLFWNETIQALIINRILEGVIRLGLEAYRHDQFLNTLVILDEAQRLARKEEMENERQEKMRQTLLDAVNTTRKYGLGWMFISTSISNMDKNIINQMRIGFFGHGLMVGSEFQSLKEHVGDISALKLYQTFSDPHSVLEKESREYSFMATGPVSPLSSSITPLSFNAFSTADEFLKANNLA